MSNINYTVLLGLRIALVVILYLVILQIVAVSRREMRRADRKLFESTSARPIVGYLVVLDNGTTHLQPGQRIPLDPITTIGRAPTNTVVLDSLLVSAEHSRIFSRDNRLWVEDLDSRNFTFVDDKKVVQAVAVIPGSVLKVGDVRFEFRAP